MGNVGYICACALGVMSLFYPYSLNTECAILFDGNYSLMAFASIINSMLVFKV